MKILILVIGLYSFQSMALSLISKDFKQKVQISIPTLEINSSLIVDPTKEFSEIYFENQIIKIPNEQIFLAQSEYSKTIRAKTHNWFVHLNLKKVSHSSYWAIITLQNYSSNKTLHLNGFMNEGKIEKASPVLLGAK